MRRTIIASVSVGMILTGVFFTGGCHEEQEPIAPPVTDAQLQSMRMEFHQQYPTARVGVVTAVLESENLASVGKVPTKDFTEGDIITFMDSNGKTLTEGKVEAVNADNLAVKYETPGKKGRAPMRGDVAVRIIH
jgi:hypothetical protein